MASYLGSYGNGMWDTSGSSFGIQLNAITGNYRLPDKVRFCAYCRQQKEALLCLGCGARMDLLAEDPIGQVAVTYYTPKKKSFFAKVFA